MKEGQSLKPVGLVLIAIYTGISAVLNVFGGVGFMLAGVIQQWAPILGFAFVLFGVAAFAATYGLWVLALWGHSLARVLYIISIPLGVIVLVSNRTPGNVILQLVGIGLAVWILVYLSNPKTEGLFRAGSGRPTTA